MCILSTPGASARWIAERFGFQVGAVSIAVEEYGVTNTLWACETGKAIGVEPFDLLCEAERLRERLAGKSFEYNALTSLLAWMSRPKEEPRAIVGFVSDAIPMMHRHVTEKGNEYRSVSEHPSPRMSDIADYFAERAPRVVMIKVPSDNGAIRP